MLPPNEIIDSSTHLPKLYLYQSVFGVEERLGGALLSMAKLDMQLSSDRPEMIGTESEREVSRLAQSDEE